MIRNVLSHIRDVESYGIIAILLFFVVFLVVLVWAFRLKKPQLDAMSRLPLEAADEPLAPASNLNPAPRHHE